MIERGCLVVYEDGLVGLPPAVSRIIGYDGEVVVESAWVLYERKTSRALCEYKCRTGLKYEDADWNMTMTVMCAIRRAISLASALLVFKKEMEKLDQDGHDYCLRPENTVA